MIGFKAYALPLEAYCTSPPEADRSIRQAALLCVGTRYTGLTSPHKPPMSTESLKLELIEHLLRTTDEGLLKQVAALFRSAKGEVDEDGLTDEHYNIVKERYAEYKRGEGKSYTWEEVREMARKAKKA